MLFIGTQFSILYTSAKAAEVRLTRLAEKMQRALEALRFEAATQANAREREQHQCCSCYKVVSVSAGLGCEYLLVLDGHFICASCVNCAPNEVKRIVEAIREAEPLARHKAQAGHIMCVRQDCDAMPSRDAVTGFVGIVRCGKRN